MDSLKKRLERLENKQYLLPTATVTLTGGEKMRMDICEISRRFFEGPNDIEKVEWIGGDCSGVVCQLLACDDLREEIRRHRNEQN